MESILRAEPPDPPRPGLPGRGEIINDGGEAHADLDDERSPLESAVPGERRRRPSLRSQPATRPMNADNDAASAMAQEDGRPRSARLTPGEARRALYVDFEGRRGKPPVLLGCAHRPGRGETPWVWQAVVDPLFRPLANADDLPLLALPDAVERILQRAEANDAAIVAWSEHELRVVREHCPAPLVDRFERRFVNARKVAARWTSALPPEERPASQRLADYLAFIGHRVPDGAGPGQAGDAIRILGAALERGRGAAGLTHRQRLRWAQLRAHNRYDCAGMRRVCLAAARDLESRERRAEGGSQGSLWSGGPT